MSSVKESGYSWLVAVFYYPLPFILAFFCNNNNNNRQGIK